MVRRGHGWFFDYGHAPPRSNARELSETVRLDAEIRQFLEPNRSNSRFEHLNSLTLGTQPRANDLKTRGEPFSRRKAVVCVHHLPFAWRLADFSVLLKSMIGELECPAVFGDVADEFVAGSVWEFGLDFKGDFNFGSQQSRQVLDHFFRYTGCVAAHA